MRRASRTDTMRIVRSGMIVTTEYRLDRLTADVDTADPIVRAARG